ncbi:MAG: inner membrane CreD family protein [Phycisphaerae bacterium]|jgi:hypothetical protein
MNGRRLLAIGLLFVGASLAWLVLGKVVWSRTHQLDNRLSDEMRSLWGPSMLVQRSPHWSPQANAPTGADPASSHVTANIHHNHRYKGLLWYSTFSVDFEGRYTLSAAASDEPNRAGTWYLVFELPNGVTGYENLSVLVDDKPREITSQQIAAGVLSIPVQANEGAAVTVRYTTNGQDMWLYSPSTAPEPSHRPARIREEEEEEVPSLQAPTGPLVRLGDFSLTVNANFRDIDYPKGSRSPSQPAQPTKDGVTASWKFANALTNQSMGIVMPHRANAGPIIARMSLFAPVSLLFFFTAVFTVVVLKRIQLHPMHYLFLAAGFFAFHILLAYTADKISIHAAFWICAAVSVVLVVSYMQLVAGARFALFYIGLAQLVYLIGFSYAFFFPGWTGLTVVIGAVVTLFVLMQATGRVNWFEVFERGGPPLPPSAGPSDQDK